MNLFIVLYRTLFFYFFILLSYRLMGKREIGELSLSDLTISILIAELVAISIENRKDNMLLTITPIFLLVFLEIGFAYIQLKINSIRNIINGKPSTIINKGKLNIKEMIKQRYSIDDLLIALRNNGYRGIHEIEYAILETNGNLSVFPKDKKNDSEYPFPIIVDGVVDIDSLKGINKSEFWLKNFLLVRGYDIKNILYAFYKKGKIFIVKK